MDNLRLVLLITGCLIVLGIYVWEIFFRNGAKKNSDILEAVDEIPGLFSSSDIAVPSIPGEKHTDYSETIADLGNLLARCKSPVVEDTDTNKILTSNAELADDFDKELLSRMNVKENESRLENNDDFDVFAAIEEKYKEAKTAINNETMEEPDIAEEDEEKEELPGNNQSSEDLLVLYITGSKHTVFNGLSVSKAADAVGMVFGNMNIFHYFGAGKLHSQQPLFSMANMFEPGSFEPDKMAKFRTKGIVLFMYLPTSIDAGVVFELFINTAQQISRLLGGELKTASNENLNTHSMKALREKAESLSAK